MLSGIKNPTIKQNSLRHDCICITFYFSHLLNVKKEKKRESLSMIATLNACNAQEHLA